VDDGLSGVSYLVNYMRSGTPYAYLHLIALVVKCANYGMCSFSGVCMVRSMAHLDGVEAASLAAQTVFITGFNNAILISSLYMLNPLLKHCATFPLEHALQTLDADAKGLDEAKQRLPPLLRQSWGCAGTGSSSEATGATTSYATAYPPAS